VLIRGAVQGKAKKRPIARIARRHRHTVLSYCSCTVERCLLILVPCRNVCQACSNSTSAPRPRPHRGETACKTWMMLFPRRAAEELQPSAIQPSAFSKRGLNSICPLRQVKWCGPQPWSWVRAWNIATREFRISLRVRQSCRDSRREKLIPRLMELLVEGD